MKYLGILLMVLVFATTAVSAVAQFGDIMRRIGIGEQLNNDKIVSGLKEALQVGTDNAVKTTGRTDGYFLNEAIKILMPEKLRTVEKALRVVGYGPQLDEFVLSMNRAAEKAAPFAKEIFLNAILEMSFDDASKILSGGDTAATDFFKDKTSDELSQLFHPIVEQVMSETGVIQQYDQLIGRAQDIPFLNTAAPDIDEYVVSKALDGLFHVLGEEERKIRKNPAARVTDLLKEVFG